MTEPTEAAIEAAARAIYAYVHGPGQGDPDAIWEGAPLWTQHKDEALVALRAAQAATPEGEVVERRRFKAVKHPGGHDLYRDEDGKWCDLMFVRLWDGEAEDCALDWGQGEEVVAVDITVRRLPTVATTTADVGDAT